MSSAVMISIRPKWCELIASGRKTVEVRKTRPKIEVPFKCYIYETKTGYRSKSYENDILVPYQYAGKVIGEFVCDYIEYYMRVGFDGCQSVKNSYFRVDDRYYIHPINYENMQLSKEQLERYTDGTPAYGWHISDLVIYDQPKELGEFYTRKSVFEFRPNGEIRYSGMMQPPQSWCYVEELEVQI